MDDIIEVIVEEFSKFKSVKSIALAGSRATGFQDIDSDYDFYIYRCGDIDIKDRKKVFDGISKIIELDNNYWEDEDNLQLQNDTYVDIIYRDINWLDSELNRVVINHKANIGYTTCLWNNLLNSKILYDREGDLNRLKKKYEVKYPEKLKESILKKNIPIISGVIPSLVTQVEKAIKRDDLISVNHRISEYLAAYFDVLFAKNEVTHPGEKRLVERASKLCKILPMDFKKDITLLLTDDKNRIEKLNVLTEKLISM